MLPAIEVARVMSKLSNIRNDRGRTPLMLASKGGHVEVVGFLLEHHVRVRRRRAHSAARSFHLLLCSPALWSSRLGVTNPSTRTMR